MSERLLRVLRRIRRPAVLGTIRRRQPFSKDWGFDRGLPVDRYYIEDFLARHAADIRGDVLEVKNNDYTERFGTAVEKSDVLDVDPSNPRATYVADLAAAEAIPDRRFDCFVLTQTLHLIYDLQEAIAHSHRILKPGGVLLATLPSVSRIIPHYGLKADHWRVTPASCQRLFGDRFGADNVSIASYGSFVTCIGFLAGMATEEFSRRELDRHDPYFPVLLAVRAVRPVGNA